MGNARLRFGSDGDAFQAERDLTHVTCSISPRSSGDMPAFRQETPYVIDWRQPGRAGTFPPMGRSRVARILSLIIGMTASLGTPGLAVTHGYSHHEQHEHEAHTAASQAGLPVATDLTPLADPGPAEEHGHPDLRGVVCARNAQVASALPAMLVTLPPATVLVPTMGPISAEPERPPASAHPPPSSSRAPPALT